MQHVLFVQENDGISFQVIDANLAGLQIANWHPPAIFPVFAAGNINEQRSNEEGIFPLDRSAHSRQGVITFDLRDAHFAALRNARVTIVGALSTLNRAPSRCP
jgi:hypothetical protein